MRLSVRILILIPVFGMIAFNAGAQTIELLSPTNPITIYEGDDFASNELENAWDGNERRDIGWEEGLIGNEFGGISSYNGILKSEFSGKNGHFYPLFQGYTGSLFAEGVDGDKTLPRFGRKHPIDASKYKYLSYRLNLSNRSVGSVSWSDDSPTSLVGGGWPNHRGTYFDGYYTPTDGVSRAGFYTYFFDLSSLDTTFGRGLYDGSWRGKVISLRIEPSSFSDSGTKLDIDWIRLTDPSSAPIMDLRWRKLSIPPASILSIGYSTSKDDPTDFTPVQQFAKGDPGYFQFPLSALPPGEYYFYLALISESTKLITSKSSPSPLVRILSAPELFFTSPNQLSGEDYAKSTILDPWDMANEQDVSNLNTSSWPQLWRQFSDFTFSGGRFSAVSDLPLTSIKQTDAQVHLNVSPSYPIDTSKYRYLTYRVAIDESNHPSIAEKAADGWVMRVVGWNDNHTIEPGAFMPAGHLVYEGEHTYTYDLWDESAETLDLGSSWRSNPWLYHLRLDPLESGTQTRFTIDDVWLTAEPRPNTTGIFPISFSLAGQGQYEVRVWASTYSGRSVNPSTDYLIANYSALTSGNYQFNWDMSILPAQSRWYIKAEVSVSGLPSRFFTASIPVVAGLYAPPTMPIDAALPKPQPQPTSDTPTQQDNVTFERSKLSRRAVREGDYLSIQTRIRIGKGDKLRGITATLRSSKRTFSVKLRAVGRRNYAGLWRARRVGTNRRTRFSVGIHAQTKKGEEETLSLGRVRVDRRS